MIYGAVKLARARKKKKAEHEQQQKLQQQGQVPSRLAPPVQQQQPPTMRDDNATAYQEQAPPPGPPPAFQSAGENMYHQQNPSPTPPYLQNHNLNGVAANAPAPQCPQCGEKKKIDFRSIPTDDRFIVNATCLSCGGKWTR